MWSCTNSVRAMTETAYAPVTKSNSQKSNTTKLDQGSDSQQGLWLSNILFIYSNNQRAAAEALKLDNHKSLTALVSERSNLHEYVLADS